MQVKQFSPKLNPELFFLPRDTGKLRRVYKKTSSGVEYYSHSEPIIAYDKPHETRVIDGGVAKRRRSARGIQELRLYMDRVELWHYDDEAPDVPRCLSTCYIYMQVLDWDANTWVNVRFHNVMPKVIDDGDRFIYEYKDNGRTFALEGYWTKGNAKSTYYATAPGEMVRVRGTMLVYAPDEVKVNYDDFKGVDIVDDRLQDYPRAGMQMRTITFGNDGQLDHIEVDPYIEVDEQSTYIEVTCDGYLFRVGSDEYSNTLASIVSPSATGYVSFLSDISVGGSSYSLARNASELWEFTVVTPTYVKVTQKGVPMSGGSPLAGLDMGVIIWHVYPDRLFVEYWHETSATLDFQQNNSFFYVYGSSSNLTSETTVKESSGAESNISGQIVVDQTNASDYWGIVANEMDIIAIHLNSGDYAHEFYNEWWTGRFSFRNEAIGSTPAGDRVMYTAFGFIIDSASREGSAKLYTSTERLEMGAQFTDLDIPALTSGTLASDLVQPKTLTDYAGDGAIHVIPDANKEASLSNDIIRHKQAIVVHDPHIYTGDPASPTDHLVGWWKCDDNAASTAIVAEVGSNGTLQGGANTADITNTKAVRGSCLSPDGVDDYIDLSSTLTSLADTNKFTVAFDFRPNFAFDVATNQLILYISDGTEYISFYYDQASDVLRINFQLGTGAGFNSTAYANNTKLQQWYTFQLSVDLDNDIAVTLLNGEILAVHTLTDTWSATPTNLYLSSDGTNYGATAFDNVRLYDGCLLPFGAYFTGNGSVDSAVAHGDVVCYWDCESAGSLYLDSPLALFTPTINSGSFTTLAKLVGTNGLDTEGRVATPVVDITPTSIITLTECRLCAWINVQTSADSSHPMSIRFDANGEDYVALAFNDEAGSVAFYGQAACANTTYTADNTTNLVSAGTWNWVEVVWKDSTFLQVWVNGQLFAEQTTIGTMADTTINKIFIGYYADCYIDQFCITSDSNTPQIPTVFGQPVHAPMIKVV